MAAKRTYEIDHDASLEDYLDLCKQIEEEDQADADEENQPLRWIMKKFGVDDA